MSWRKLLPLLLLGACSGGDGPVRVGLAISLEEAGAIPAKHGAELAAREINADGGIGGRPFELVERDDHGNPDSAVAVAEALYASDVSAVVGGVYSGLTLAAAPIYNGGRRPLVQLSPSASSPAITHAGDYTFRLCPTDLAYGAALAQFAADRGYHRAAVLYVNDAYGRGVRQTFAAEFSRLGGEVVEVDPFLAGDPEVGPFLDRVAMQRRVDVLVLAANQGEGLKALRQIRARRLPDPVLAGDGMSGAERTDPALMEGVFVASGYVVGTPSLANRRFVAAYTAMFPNAGPPDQVAAATYDAVRLLARTIGESGPGRSELRAALARVGANGVGYEGVVGRVAFDSAGDAPSLKVRVAVARGGVLVPAQ